jgi:hypothetical protein
MKSTQIDYLNIGLMFLALLLALKIPFELFLFSYAVLGPLHYLTEMNWLKERDYFSKNKNVFWVMLILAGIISISPVVGLLSHVDLTADLFHFWPESSLRKLLSTWTPIVIFMSLIAGISFALFQKMWVTLIISVAAGILGYILKDQNVFVVLLGTFLPTLIHVYVFTGLFMLFGALKTKSTPGLVAVACLIACAFVIFNYSFAKFTVPSNAINKAYNESAFYSLIEESIKTFQLKMQYSKSLNITFIKLQSFMAFAYTYHYLNWFSKTSIIKWYKVSKKQLLFIGALWTVSVGLYYYNYRVGLTLLFLLSFMHVLLEFPLNVVSVRGIWEISVAKLKNTI